MDAPEELLIVWREGRATPLVRSAGHSLSVFGGPLELEVGGAPCGPRPLHQIGVLARDHLGPDAPPSVPELPLVFGLAYSGCRLQYGFERGAIEVRSIEPARSLDDWPYPGYPDLLPYVPLEVGRARRLPWKELARDFPALPDEPPAELVALVPPPATLGISLWGREGDAEGVTLLFEVALAERRVVASTVCT